MGKESVTSLLCERDKETNDKKEAKNLATYLP